MNGGVRGGDGFTFWFVEEPKKPGNMFGSSDQFKGLAIIFDSWDDDGKEDNPFVTAMVNDGTKKYDHRDGETSNVPNARCSVNYRNTQNAVVFKFTYKEKSLKVLLASTRMRTHIAYRSRDTHA